MKYFQDRFFALDRTIKGLQKILEKFANKNFFEVPNNFLFFINYFLIILIASTFSP